MPRLILRSRSDDDGATAVEYAVMVALIAATIVLVVTVIGRQTRSGFCDAQTKLDTAGVSSGLDPAGGGC